MAWSGIYLRRVTAGAHVFLSRVIAETKRAARCELPLNLLINKLDVIEFNTMKAGVTIANDTNDDSTI